MITKMKIENLKNQKEPLWIAMHFDTTSKKDIWNKTFNFYLTKEGNLNDVELICFISNKTKAKLWNLANKHLAKAQERLDKGGSFLLATIHKGTIVDINS